MIQKTRRWKSPVYERLEVLSPNVPKACLRGRHAYLAWMPRSSGELLIIGLSLVEFHWDLDDALTSDVKRLGNTAVLQDVRPSWETTANTANDGKARRALQSDLRNLVSVMALIFYPISYGRWRLALAGWCVEPPIVFVYPSERPNGLLNSCNCAFSVALVCHIDLFLANWIRLWTGSSPNAIHRIWSSATASTYLFHGCIVYSKLGNHGRFWDSVLKR